MRILKFLLPALLLCAPALPQAGKPDFSGTWKLNNPKSTQDGPADRVYIATIQQTNKTITVGTKAAGVTNLLDGVFPTNSKARIERIGKNYRFIKVGWEGSTLVFEITDKDGKKDTSKALMYIRESWTLSPDGKVLTKFRRTAQTIGKGINDQKYVFDKQ